MPAIRDQIVDTAKQWAGKIYLAEDGKMVGGDELVGLYKTTGRGGNSILLGGMWSPIVESGIRQGMWIRKVPLTPIQMGGRNQESVHKYCTALDGGEGVNGPVAWCGIFATFVIKKAGLLAHWANQQINCDNYVRWGNGVKGSPTGWKSQIEKGDVCCLDTKPGANNNHHIIVVNVIEGSDKLDTVEGNLSSPRQSVQALTGRRSRNDIYTLYKLKENTVK
jgi:hypothetical protein